ncbi:MAG: HD domain-containing protein [bacterium]|nr:HD domain-containing protein [bacterium]
MSGLSDMMKFIELTHRLQQVRRTIFVNHEERNENDVEHMYQLAMVSWYIIEREKLPLDIPKVLRYALVHDVVEAYAGDTYFYSDDKDDKARREHAAAERLKKEFPEFPDLHECIEAFERREDAESKFVYALDKVIPVVNIYMDGGRSWKRDGVTFVDVLKYKTDKVAVSQEVKVYFDELVERLRAEETSLFPRKA